MVNWLVGEEHFISIERAPAPPACATNEQFYNFRYLSPSCRPRRSCSAESWSGAPSQIGEVRSTLLPGGARALAARTLRVDEPRAGEEAGGGAPKKLFGLAAAMQRFEPPRRRVARARGACDQRQVADSHVTRR
jgi:hypothetical protein